MPIKMLSKNRFRTHLLNEVNENNIGTNVTVAGFVENIRDHGGVKFVDLRDHYGISQVVVYDENMLSGITKESVITLSGKIIKRHDDTINEKIASGTVEIEAYKIEVLSRAESLPFDVATSTQTNEETRLKYRFLDLRNKKVHENIVLRSKVTSFLRDRMTNMGFLDIQTPILSASSPEGARDYLIPSRKHPGKFYALPQAPQIFKQLLMASGFDKYFQIAPCFRDEDSRADRSPGEFYQLDFEMAFAEQEDVFEVAEKIIYDVFCEFSNKKVTKPPFKRIPYAECMLKYGTDKPDLRNPLEIIDVSNVFSDLDFIPFKNKTVKAINVPNCAGKSKSFFENMLSFALKIGMKGLGYVKITDEMNFLGPIDKFLTEEKRQKLIEKAKLKPGSVLYFIADNKINAPVFAGQIRTELANRLNIIDKEIFGFCFVVDFPMYGIDEKTGEIEFTHNPFSMPQGGMNSLINKNPLDILAYQYDIVCNGVELSSGAVRNHDLKTLIKAFDIAGYSQEVLKCKFNALYEAFQYGVPPHAGMAPGLDRILMLLTDEDNIREVIAFPMNSSAQDLLLKAPSEVSLKQLRELNIKINK